MMSLTFFLMYFLLPFFFFFLSQLNLLCVISQYLRNLDPNSAYYDPKTRSMRENPYSNAGKNPDE